MSQITSDIKIASNALLLLGGETIASFTEPTAGSTIADNLYQSSLDGMLSAHRWRFATKTLKLSRLVGAGNANYTAKFALPSDLLYLIKTDGNNRNYEIYGKELHTSVTAVEIDYVYKVDETELPAYFIKALEFYLAFQFAVPLTGDMEKGNYYRIAYEAELKRAKFADSTQRPGDALQAAGRYVKARY